MSIPRKFYKRDTEIVARELLGKRLVRKIGRGVMSGVIIETEAYKHRDDPASHAFKSMTRRNRVMFGEVGMAYVYFTYGMHYCFNVVARSAGVEAGAVLIRAVRPEKGINMMQKNRGMKNIDNLADGPAKLTQAMRIAESHYGADLTDSHGIYIADGPKPRKISASARIGIRQATDRLWNFKSV
ncbi:MAG: DNA-3-methyladenine glycosylase [Nitrosopumilus sp. B06]|nr:MAG: DNA-3-methyladenine glycosylase [Nitrosopumilus sp. D6]RNJ78956.1 MAG: DNA-3-methyladenine glycosylase [Nitrosopumilus sp. B06]